MHTLTRLLVIACLALPFAACKKQEEAPKAAAAEQAPLTAPKNDDTGAWRAYVTEVAKRNMDGITNSPYVYFLPSESSEGFGGQYERQLEKLEGDLGRGILEGNMLVFASPASTKMAELVETAFKQVGPNSMKGVKVVFIGSAIDGERVKAAVTPAGVNYVFVEAK
ncbi:hypothetical protein [Thermomonas flagellata]|uniref:hypothetical protein n=1 Tax=Thermomonas flagellata TaxID=2888524 RepID=UPI001F03529A|nr:hypothetical protein [Thermomonas flagellata]